MGELEQQYEDQVQFTIIPAEQTALAKDEIAEYGFTDLRHGLVVFDDEGVAVVKIPGHQFGKSEIEAGITQVLPTE